MISALLSHDTTLSVHLALAANYAFAAQIARHHGHGDFCRVYIAGGLLYILLVASHAIPAFLGAH